MRPATWHDLPRIVEIYNSTVPGRRATSDPVPVSVEQRTDWFRNRDPRRHPILVEEAPDMGVIAWCSFQPFYGRPAYAATAEISIYIDEMHRGRGLGTRLLSEAVALAPTLGLKTLLAFVFSHNEPSLRLFRNAGFCGWGELPGVAEMDGVEFGLTILGLRVAERGDTLAPVRARD